MENREFLSFFKKKIYVYKMRFLNDVGKGWFGFLVLKIVPILVGFGLK